MHERTEPLGLSIAKRPVEMHRGRMDAVSGRLNGLVVSTVLPAGS